MPRTLQRKLIDCKTTTELAAIYEALEVVARIPIDYHCHQGRHTSDDFYRVYVYVAHLQKAREIVAKLYPKPSELFAEGQKLRAKLFSNEIQR